MTPAPRSLSDALQRLNETARQKYRRIQNARVVAVHGTESATVNFQGREVTLPISGPVALTVGETVAVAVREGAPYLIMMNYARRSGAIGISSERTGSIVEVLFGVTVGGRTELYFRNWQEVSKLEGVREQIGAEPTGVRWGADRKSFVVQTGTGNGRKFHVYAFGASKRGDQALEPGARAGKVTRLRVEEPFASQALLRTLTADGQEWRSGMSVRLYVSAGRIRTVSYHYNPANPPGGLQIVQQVYEAQSRIDEHRSPVSEQHAMLEVPLRIGPLLSNAIPGVACTLEEFGLDRERHLILTTTIALGLAGAPVTGAGVLVREGELLKTYPGSATPPHYPLRDLLVEDATAPGPDFYPDPTMLPTVGPITGWVLSNYLHEGHALVIDATAGRVPFTTLREQGDLDLVTDARVAYDGMSMLADTLHGTDNQRGANQRHVLWSYEHITTVYAGGFGSETQGGAGESSFGSIVYHSHPYGTDYALVRVALDAAKADASAAGKIPVETLFGCDVHWPDGPDGIANITGTRRARGDLWRTFGFLEGEAPELRQITLGREQSVVAQDLGLYTITGEGATGINYNTLPIGEAFMQRFQYFAAFRWSLRRYHERRTLPVHYRVRRSRVLTLGGSDATVLLVVERVRNSATDGAPVWAKHLGVFVCRFDGGLVARLLDWTAIPTFDAAGAGRVIDPWFGGSGAGGVGSTLFYDDGSQVDVLAVSGKHVLWTLSTLAQRQATPAVRSIYLSHAERGGKWLVGTDLSEFSSQRFRLLGLDLLYKSTEPPPKGRRFIRAWNPRTGEPSLEQKAKGYPIPDTPLDPVAPLADLGKLSAGAVVDYHAVNDRDLLTDVGRSIVEKRSPYPVN